MAFRAALLAAGAAGASAVTSVIDLGPLLSQVALPACQLDVACNGDFCADVCVDGSVVVPPATATLRFQYDLQLNRSLRATQILGTHNAMISRANGYGLTEDLAASLFARTLPPANLSTTRVANQRLGPTDLLNLGVRELELDLWFIPWGDNTTADVRICHFPFADPQYDDALQAAADALGMGTLKYSPANELCGGRTLAWALGKVSAWLGAPGNRDETGERKRGSRTVQCSKEESRRPGGGERYARLCLRTRRGRSSGRRLLTHLSFAAPRVSSLQSPSSSTTASTRTTRRTSPTRWRRPSTPRCSRRATWTCSLVGSSPPERRCWGRASGYTWRRTPT
jgi:hypothetical protein